MAASPPFEYVNNRTQTNYASYGVSERIHQLHVVIISSETKRLLVGNFKMYGNPPGSVKTLWNNEF